MNRLSFSRRALCVCGAALFLAGCGGSLNVPSALEAGMPGAARTTPAHGGAFSASYYGTFTWVRKGRSVAYTVDGSGTASLLGPSWESGRIVVTCAATGRDCWGSGILALRNTKNPKVAIFMKVEFGGTWCPQGAQYLVDRGHRRFRGAIGSGTVAFSCSGTNAYSDQWLGTLSFLKGHTVTRVNRAI